MVMKKLLFILNPIAGMRRASRSFADMTAIFNRAGYEVSAFVTAAGGDAEEAVCRYASQVDRIVCCGGDGTFNETISGLMRCGEKTPLGYIPAGSTNDFANSLHLQTDCLKAAQAIVDGTPYVYDIGIFGTRYFSYVASFGAFTRASYATPQNVKNALGHLAYVLEGISELSQIRPIYMKMQTDNGTVEGEYLFGAVCNSTSVGGILTLDPDQVDMSDGKFEVLLIRAPRELGELTECIQAMRNKRYTGKMMTFFSASDLTVESNAPQVWTLDGERAEQNDAVRICNVHHAITLIK